MEKDYPFLTDYAKSGRSTCKSCKNIISKESLRLASIVRSHLFDGQMTCWFHFKCFFKKIIVKNIDDIKNVDSLRWEDQQKIRSEISEFSKDGAFSEYDIEYAKPAKSKCAKCQLIINKGSIRISCKESESDKAKMEGTSNAWHHVDCFHEMKSEVLIRTPDFDFTKIAGLGKLTEADNEEVVNKFESWKSKKRAAEEEGERKSEKKRAKKELAVEDEMKHQNDLLWRNRDRLQKEISKSALIDLLIHNKQCIPAGESNLLDVLSDVMVFGCISSCPECGGSMIYSCNKYKCTSSVNEWTKCIFETTKVERSSFKIPQQYAEVEVMKDYVYVQRDRLLTAESASQNLSAPLKGYSLVIGKGTFTGGYSKPKIVQRIKDLGGTVSNSLSKSSVALILNSQKRKEKVDLSDAKMYNIDVVTPGFLDNLETENLLCALKKYGLADWGRNKGELSSLRNLNNSVLDEVIIEENKMQTLRIKGGAVVDPDSELEDKAHLFRDKISQDPLNVTLGMVDPVRGSNSFYKLQLLESDTKKKWWVFRSWGRIGTTIGGNKKESFAVWLDAMCNFEEVYLDKTGNRWQDRHQFEKKAHRFYPMDVDYAYGDLDLSFVKSSSTLPKPVDKLVRFICDIPSMKKAMLEFKIDLRKMPLGKLSKKQVDLSYGVLGELQKLLQEPEPPSKTKLLELATMFYTFLPHDFGMRAPPLIDSLNVIKTKLEMIDNLKEIEIAYQLMSGGGGPENTVDACYGRLHNRLTVLERDTAAFYRIERYLRNTHADTHDQYSLEIETIFDLARDGEEVRFKSFRQLPNRMMLWHGSRRTNFAGILSQGLRIAPPEAPISGYMFGKGIYFADMVSKSANYCFPDPSRPVGLLMLCEVALGSMAERFQSDPNISLRAGEHSCKGVGASFPNPCGDVVDEDGVTYPMGSPCVSQSHKGDLRYNEYIVYDAGQIRQRFLLKVNFKYKSGR